MYLVGSLHDIGKATSVFQDYIKDHESKKKIYHSLPGAKMVYDKLRNFNVNPTLTLIIVSCILGHHTSLKDFLSPFPNNKTFLKMLSEKLPDEYDLRPVELLLEKFVNEEVIKKINKEWEELNQKINDFLKGYTDNSIKILKQLYIHFIVRFCYSSLIDADRLDAKNFEENIEFSNETTDFTIYIKNLEKKLKFFKSDTKLNQYRNSISKACLSASNEDKGIYKLEIPTGGGKTLSSLRFALSHAQKHNHKKIIYVIPYLSITEQTSKIFHNFLNIPDNSNEILECHSQFIPKNENDFLTYDYLESRWEGKIIITTLVQFLESAFSSKASMQRKFHNFFNATIIFDEIQSIPPKTISLFNMLINFLTDFGKNTCILCSATQLPLESTTKKLNINSKDVFQAKNIKINDTPKTKIKLLLENQKLKKFKFDELSKKILCESCSTLIIVNTKNNALKIFKSLKENAKEENVIYHLSTNMCSAHRKEVISKIKNDLNKKRKVFCVSTQLIEAGVDISFQRVYREIVGLDSIIQAAGRCNRNKEYHETQDVFVFDLCQSNTSNVKDLSRGIEIMREMINFGVTDFEDEETIKSYYTKLINRNDKENGLFDYWVKCDNYEFSLFDLHSLNSSSLKNNSDSLPPLTCAYETINNHFHLIEKSGTTVIVDYNDEAREIIDKIRNGEFNESIIRRSYQYTINIYLNKSNTLDGLELINDVFWVLSRQNYDSEIGLKNTIDELLIL